MITSYYSKRALRHTHTIVVRDGDWRDMFGATPVGAATQEWARAETLKRYPGMRAEWTVEIVKGK